MSSTATSLVQAFLASGSLPLSRSIGQVQTLLSSADYDSRDLAEFLRLDPTLAARVMAAANSAYFSRRRCGDIDDAVSRLGTVQLSRIFTQILASSTLINPLRAYGLPTHALWQRSVFTAIGAELAAGRRGDDRSAAYTIGLLHLLGMLVIDDLWIKAGSPRPLVRVDFDREWSADEFRLCGFTHAVLGEELLRQLQFPPAVCTAVGRQYEPPTVPVEHALYVGRLVQSCAYETPTLDPDSLVLREFKLTAPDQLDAFLNDVRTEAQSFMRAA
ncbi:MAG: HDOD domain-containing protein [Opitutaceae bacterium]|nr:HDOD domain-containing protein [Opitutaceae bacterium]